MKPTHNWQTVWRTKDGRTIPIKEMTDSHLTNTIRFLERAHQRYVDDITAIGPPEFQGEMAQYYADEEYATIASSRPDNLFPIFMWLIIEASEREERRIRERHDSHNKVTPTVSNLERARMFLVDKLHGDVIVRQRRLAAELDEAELRGDLRSSAEKSVALLKQSYDHGYRCGMQYVVGATTFAMGQLRHLYAQMIGGHVKNPEQAARGLLGPSIEAIELALMPPDKVTP